MESSFFTVTYYVQCMAVWLMLQSFSFLSSFKDYVGICKDIATYACCTLVQHNIGHVHVVTASVFLICIQRCHARYPFYFHVMNLLFANLACMQWTFCMFRDCAPAVDTEMHGVPVEHEAAGRAARSRSDSCSKLKNATKMPHQLPLSHTDLFLPEVRQASNPSTCIENVLVHDITQSHDFISYTKGTAASAGTANTKGCGFLLYYM